MTDKDKALSLEQTLRLALRALRVTWYHVGTFAPTDEAIELYDEAITAIKAALLSRSDGEAKDEPVAWRDAAIRLGEELSSVGPDGYYDMDAKEWLDWAMEQNPRGKHSLPQRTWVGLTGEEKIIMSRYDLEYAALIGEVERKLKEKNRYD